MTGFNPYQQSWPNPYVNSFSAARERREGNEREYNDVTELKDRHLRYKVLREGGKKPFHAHPDDAGFDLFVSETVVVPPHSFLDVPTAVAVELPSDSWGFLTGRSSTIRKKSLLVQNGVIDPGYRGELFSAVWNLSNEFVTVEKGDRVAQLILVPSGTAPTFDDLLRGNEEFELEEVRFLSSHDRGEKGFGSSGV